MFPANCTVKSIAQALSTRVTEADLAEGRLYPPLSTIRECSVAIAAYIAEHAYKTGTFFPSSIDAAHFIDLSDFSINPLVHTSYSPFDSEDRRTPF